MKKTFLLLGVILFAISAEAKDYAISTPNTTLIVSADKGKQLNFRYYGSRAEASDVRAAGRMVKHDAYPAFGTRCDMPYASLVKQHDGDNAMKLIVESVEESKVGELSKLTILHPTHQQPCEGSHDTENQPRATIVRLSVFHQWYDVDEHANRPSPHPRPRHGIREPGCIRATGNHRRYECGMTVEIVKPAALGYGHAPQTKYLSEPEQAPYGKRK